MRPKTEVRMHMALTALWGFLIVPAVLFWKHSVFFLVLASVYANFVGHFAAYQGAKAKLESRKK